MEFKKIEKSSVSMTFDRAEINFSIESRTDRDITGMFFLISPNEFDTINKLMNMNRCPLWSYPPRKWPRKIEECNRIRNLNKSEWNKLERNVENCLVYNVTLVNTKKKLLFCSIRQRTHMYIFLRRYTWLSVRHIYWGKIVCEAVALAQEGRGWRHRENCAVETSVGVVRAGWVVGTCMRGWKVGGPSVGRLDRRGGTSSSSIKREREGNGVYVNVGIYVYI